MEDDTDIEEQRRKRFKGAEQEFFLAQCLENFSLQENSDLLIQRRLRIRFVCVSDCTIWVCFGHLACNDGGVNTTTQSYQWGTSVGESTADHETGQVFLVGRVFSLTFFGLLGSVAELIWLAKAPRVNFAAYERLKLLIKFLTNLLFVNAKLWFAPQAIWTTWSPPSKLSKNWMTVGSSLKRCEQTIHKVSNCPMKLTSFRHRRDPTDRSLRDPSCRLYGP